jgi:PTS system mannose-specific IID component
MSVLQAALIALFYAFARSSFNAGLGYYVLSQPLVAGTIAGAILGEPLRGAQIGGALNLALLALSPLQPQLRAGPDPALVGYVGVPLMLLSGLRVGAQDAVALFGALFVFGIVLNFAGGMFNTVVAHWADYFAEQANINAVALLNVVPTQIWLVLTSFLTAFVILLFDAPTITFLAATIPAWVQAAMSMSQSLLGALGIAISLRLVMQGSSVAYFLLGWLIAPSVGIVPASILGGSIAVIHAFLARRRADTSTATLATDVLPSDQSETYQADRRLTPVELGTAFVSWMFFHDAGSNFERRQNLGFATALAPVARRLWESFDERNLALRRNLTLFASEWTFGASLVGAMAALEERRANGELVSDAELVGAKSGVMASLDAVGRAVMIGGLTSVLVAIGTDLARQGYLLGPFLFALAEAAAVLTVAFVSFRLGYVQLHRFGDWARSANWLRPALFGAMRLGTFVLGALVAQYVRLALPPTAALQIGDAQIALGPRVLDDILPGLIPLAITLGMWWLLRHRHANPMVLLGLCLVLAVIVAGAMGLAGWV